MKNYKTFISILLPMLMLFVITTVNSYGYYNGDFESEGTKTFSVNKGGKLYVNLNPGTIKISAWEKNEVVIKVSGLDEDEFNNVEMSLSGNTVTVKYNPEWGWGEDAEFKITVPSQFNIEAKTSGGDIDIVSDINGTVELNTMGGEVTVKNINGKAKLSTQGGDVKVGNISGSLLLNTMGGDIRVGDVKGDFAKVSTMGGDITVGKVSSGIGAVTYGGDISISGIGGNAEIETMGGNIQVADVNGKVTMDTKGGNLRVRNATGSIKAVTYAGEIELYNVSGSADVKTMAGSISASLNPDAGSRSHLYTQNGEIVLTLPSNAKAVVEAEIKAWGNWKYMKDAYNIESDFAASESSDGERNKSISRTYNINGGGGKVILKSTNGSIKIKKK